MLSPTFPQDAAILAKDDTSDEVSARASVGETVMDMGSIRTMVKVRGTMKNASDDAHLTTLPHLTHTCKTVGRWGTSINGDGNNLVLGLTGVAII